MVTKVGHLRQGQKKARFGAFWALKKGLTLGYMVHYSNSSLGGALKSPGKNRPFALTFACHGEKTIAPRGA